MVRRLAALLVTLLALAAGLPAHAAPCPVPGETLHWIADYCMAKLETDDEIAASDCIHDESNRKFKTACGAKRHYKQALCALTRERGESVKACVADPKFTGPTVRAGGVPGR